MGFYSDPWGDKYNTIGLQISTKKKGGISDNCRKEEEKDCSAELDDITKYYKKKEDSGPGAPTMPGKSIKGTDGATADSYYIPDTNAGGHRRLARHLGERKLTVSGVKGPGKDSTLKMGTWPGKATDPIANEPSNPYSTVFLNFPFQNDGSSEEVVKCNYKAYVSDYTGANPIKVGNSTKSIILAAGAGGSCNFETHRTEWYLHASTSYDNAFNSNVPIIDKNNIPYYLKFEVTATVESSKEMFIGERIKRLGEVVTTTTSSYFYRNFKDKVPKKSLLNLIATDLEACKTNEGLSSAGFNDGYCDDSKNTAEKCYDGGDCCIMSCTATHGGLLPGLGEDPFCNLPTDNSNCKDPNYKNYLPPTDQYDTASPEDILGTPPVGFLDTGGATDFGFDICRSVYDETGAVEGSVGMVDDIIAKHFGTGNACESDAESNGCKAFLKTILCDTDEYARALPDCRMDMVSAAEIPLTTSNAPRCTGRTYSGCLCKQTWSYGGETYTGRLCEAAGVTDGMLADWCDVVEGSCDNSGNSPYDCIEDDCDPSYARWDYCHAPPKEPDGITDIDLVWTEAVEAEIIPEQKVRATLRPTIG